MQRCCRLLPRGDALILAVVLCLAFPSAPFAEGYVCFSLPNSVWERVFRSSAWCVVLLIAGAMDVCIPKRELRNKRNRILSDLSFWRWLLRFFCFTPLLLFS